MLSALLISLYNSAECIIVLVGIQPLFKQTPPILSFSKRITFSPFSAAKSAEVNPAGPEPTIPKSNLFSILNPYLV